ncbi:MAG: tetratricopeptide repeat protein, partial [Myxococcota bacterium]|nr:tetratricopeptide repeat protein [Myxococcota bacterium]
MTAVADPFLPVLDVLDRYRHDVHQLQPPPTESAAEHARRHLPIPVPDSLGRFLDRWNGASLFRGSLQVRSIHELALASQQAAQVVVFADGPSDQQWAFVPHGEGFLFGRWTGTAFQPLHDSFEPWLQAMVSILDERKTEPRAQLAARLDVDPNGPYLSLEQTRNHLQNKELDSAFVLLDGLDTGLVEQAQAWHDLGQAWLPSQPNQARNALLRAIHTLHLPCLYPTTPLDGSRLMRQLESLVDARDTGWSEQLEQILSQQITDTRQPWEIELAEAIALALSRSLLAQGERTRARNSLRDFLHRARSFQLRTTCIEAILAVARLETDLGHHDEAENYLRQLRDAPAPIQARANLVLGRLAATRQEPWAEQILREARRHMEDPADICESMILEGERLLHLDRHVRARELFERALEQATASDLPNPIALAHLGLGDLCRLAGETGEAQEHYQQARQRAGDFGELKLRLMIRHGDLLREDNPEEAASAYATAVDGYRRLQLPIREAWACLRLTQVDEPGDAR